MENSSLLSKAHFKGQMARFRFLQRGDKLLPIALPKHWRENAERDENNKKLSQSPMPLSPNTIRRDLLHGGSVHLQRCLHLASFLGNDLVPPPGIRAMSTHWGPFCHILETGGRLCPRPPIGSPSSPNTVIKLSRTVLANLHMYHPEHVLQKIEL